MVIYDITSRKKKKRKWIYGKIKTCKNKWKNWESVTSEFQKISDAVVGGYTKIEDRFVSKYLTKDGETVEEGKSTS